MARVMIDKKSFELSLELDEKKLHQTIVSESYWQRAWRQFKQSHQAMTSFVIVLSLLLFSIIGPLLWTIDPSQQDLNQISQAPALSKKALVVADISQWQVPTWQDTKATSIQALGLQLVGDPNTESVKIQWNKIKGAKAYHVYRHEFEPRGELDLGLPLQEIYDTNILGYRDRLKLEDVKYYYSVIALTEYKKILSYETIMAEPKLALTKSVALSLQEKGKIKSESNDPIEIGESIDLTIHPMGTDYLGRDMMSRLMHGGQVSLLIGFVASLIFIALGVSYGLLAGYLGGTVDNLMMRFADFVIALPFLLFMILFKVSLGVGPGESGISAMILALVLLSWPSTARLVRGQVLQIRESAFILAAKLNGASTTYILVRHLLPNVMGLVLVSLSFSIPSVILTEAFLSFIGLGVVPPVPSWGSMCNDGIKTLLFHPHELIFPALFIGLTVLAFNLLGDSLRDALDVKVKE